MPAHETRTSSTSTSSTSASEAPAYEVCPVDAGYGATAAAADPGYTSSSVAAAEIGPVASGVKDCLEVEGATLGDTMHAGAKGGVGVVTGTLDAVAAAERGDVGGVVSGVGTAVSSGATVLNETGKALGYEAVDSDALGMLGVVGVAGNTMTALDDTQSAEARTSAGMKAVEGSLGVASSGAKYLGYADDAALLGQAAAGVGGAAAIVSGGAPMLDEDAATDDRVIGGLEAAGGTMQAVGAMAGGTVEYGALSSVAAGGTGTVLASGAAVVGAGVAGYKAGSALHDAATSDYARSEKYGKGPDGKDRTLTDVVIDAGVNTAHLVEDATGSETAGLIAGGVVTTAGSIPAATFGAVQAGYNYLFGDTEEESSR
ncbi:MAG: hypothetical protein ACON4N_13155 [Myxococcota bacterium]